MNTFERIASCLAGATVVTTLGLAGSVGTAGAAKPVGGCTPSYRLVDRDMLEMLFPERIGSGLFDSIDKNGDGKLCGKQVPGLYNTVDNVASHRVPPVSHDMP